MEDWKDKLKLLKKSGALKKSDETFDDKKIAIQPKKTKPEVNQVIHQTVYCAICKKKINKDIFSKHRLEIHKIKPNNVPENNSDLEKVMVINKAYSSEKTNKQISQKNQTKNIRTFQDISDLDIELSLFNDFKEPDDWIMNFKSPIDFDITDAFDINLGLDIGTSYTKAVIDFREDKFVVDWRGITNFEDPFTLPSELSLLNNKIAIGRNKNAQKIISSFKIKLLQNNVDEEYKYAFVNYLKIVFFYIRAWWDHYYSKLNKGKTLLWNINIGLPLKNMQDEHTVSLYKKITKEAWVKSYTSNSKLLDPDSYIIEHFPEFSSQINTYLNSPKKQRGLHLLVDIGAGTTDICTFIVTENENHDLKLPNMTSSVVNHGTHTLNNERYQLINSKKIYIKTLSSSDFIEKYPNIDSNALEKIDKNFIEFIAKEIKKVLGTTKSIKYRDAPEWKKGLVSFICGGGILSNIYHEIFIEAQNSKDPFSLFSLINTPLDNPDNLKSRYPVINFHRLSVAYGLSYSAFRQPEIPTYEIDDQPGKKYIQRDDFGDNYDK